VEDAVQLLRGIPGERGNTNTLPALDWGQVDFVYAYVGAADRVLDDRERVAEAGERVPTLVTDLWHPIYAPLRRSERFKVLVRRIGLVDYWKARGWPDLCRPVGADDFECE